MMFVLVVGLADYNASDIAPKGHPMQPQVDNQPESTFRGRWRPSFDLNFLYIIILLLSHELFT